MSFLKYNFIIAELSGNHDQDFDTAKAMVKAAAEAGVDAIKLQTYTADTMTLNVRNEEFMIGEADSLWQGQNLYDLYDKACTPWEWHKPLFEYATSLGLIAFSSPFDASAVEFLESLNVPLYKVASFELTDIPLIQKIAETGKPTIMSTGMATLEEIQDAVSAFRHISDAELVLLKCTSTYPADMADSNLATIPDLAERFDCRVGLSDHTRGIGASVASIAFGATVIEKHFVLDRSAGGVDAEFSMEPGEMAALVEACQQAYTAIGSIMYGGSDAEQKAKKYRRSIYLAQDLSAGTVLQPEHIKIIRPSLGLAPKHWNNVLGKTLSSNVQLGQPLSWDLLN
ncbi:pseudaminic acid synthase [Marinomonas atlantica]|uniref:pseudaminic acid synthase n=1 Tax=Marinomonas atlantica TaxID=1806668 RepID=UPI00082ACE5E|nr:pseudaminic acid synthase [Marinomonas atlantica]